MIKLCRFEFEPLDTAGSWTSLWRFGELKSTKVEMVGTWQELPVPLQGEPGFEEIETWQFGFDPSSSCTGVFFKNMRNTIAYMLEIDRNKFEDAGTFMFNFERALHRLMDSKRVSHLVYERPIESQSYRSSQVLFQLEGYIQALPQRYPEFAAARVDNVVNSSWRKPVIYKEFSGLDRKLASRFSIIKLYPWAENYGLSLGKDQDVFEAMGVFFGWFFTAFDELGRPYARGDECYLNMAGFILPEVKAVELSKMLNEAGIESTWYVQNPNTSVFDNMASVTRKYQATCIEFCKKSSMLSLCITGNIRWTDPEILTVLMVTPSCVDKNLFDVTGDVYSFLL